MKVYSVIVFNCTNADTPTTISVGQDLSQFSFWKRGTVKEFLFFSSREVVKRTTPGTRQSIVNPNKNPDAEVSFRYLNFFGFEWKKFFWELVHEFKLKDRPKKKKRINWDFNASINDNEYEIQLNCWFWPKKKKKHIIANQNPLFLKAIERSIQTQI